MQILPWTFAVLLILAGLFAIQMKELSQEKMIYRALDHYHTAEKEIVNQKRADFFKKNQISHKKSNKNEEQPQEKDADPEGNKANAPASKKINILSLIDPSKADPLRQEFIRSTLEKLIYRVFDGCPVFTQMLQKDPHLLSRTLQNLMRRNFSSKKKGFELLKSLTFPHLEERELWVFLLKGSSLIDTQDEGNCGKSIAEYIEAKEVQEPLRLFQMERTLLKAIFNDDLWVNSMITYRKEIHKRYMQKNSVKESLEREFAEFMSTKTKLFPDHLFNYQISTTKPPI